MYKTGAIILLMVHGALSERTQCPDMNIIFYAPPPLGIPVCDSKFIRSHCLSCEGRHRWKGMLGGFDHNFRV